MAARRVSGQIPKRVGVYCLTIKNKGTRCVRRHRDGRVRFLKPGNTACNCKMSRKR